MSQVLRSNGSAKSMSRSQELPFAFPGVGNASSSAASRTLSSVASWPAKGWDDGSDDLWKMEGGGGGNWIGPGVEDLSFKNRPSVGSADPPTRLIGNFLREQIASGVEAPLDLDLEMEMGGLGRSSKLYPRKREEARAAHHQSSSSSSDDSSDDGRTSSASAPAKPLLARSQSKMRSRLMDPSPQSPVSARSVERKSSALRPPRSGPQPSGRIARKSGQFSAVDEDEEEEEDDPFLDDDVPHDHLKRGTLTTILQWVSLVLIIGALVSTLAIKRLDKERLWELRLWKWELLVLVLICGHLVAGWVIRIAVFLVERNFVLRKRALYFVYGVRGAVQNALWIGMALASWHFLFDQHQWENRRAVLAPWVTKALICLLVGTLIRLVKTVLVQMMASSFHVSTYFDRIQEALFNQYVIETLSGPELVGEDYVLAEVRELQRAGATIPKELRAALPPAKSGLLRHRASGLGKKPPPEEKKQREIDQGITMDKLHLLNQRNVSAWNMKRLMKIVRFGTLTTMDEQIQRATGEQIGESAIKIRSEHEAQLAAKNIFHNVAKPGSKHIYLADLMRFMKQEEAIKAMHLFEGAQEHCRVSKKSLKNWVVNAFRERKALALTLNDTKHAVNKLNLMANIVVCLIVSALWLLILGIATTQFFVFVGSQLVVAIFVFGNTLKTIFEAIIFLFLMHPFDVGDRCEIEEVQVVVEEMNILTTVFLRYDNLKIYYPNSVLATKPIMNFYRSPDMGEGIDFSIHVATPVEKLAIMKERILWCVHAFVICSSVFAANISTLDNLTIVFHLWLKLHQLQKGPLVPRRDGCPPRC
ncbi:unnamed protein product [Alopecurus aequalis]